MAFNIHQRVFDRDGMVIEKAAAQYQDQLLKLFAQSPEWLEFRKEKRSTGWTGMMLDYGLNYLGVALPDMSPDHLREILFEIFPRKVTAPAEDAPDVIAELQTFWKFVQREFSLENAAANLAVLDAKAVRMLKKEMSNPDNFGMAKSFVTLGKQLGYDMTSEEGINEWMQAFNAQIAPASTPSPVSEEPEEHEEPNEHVQPFRYTLKRVTGKGHKKNRKRK